jgi:uncharacterized protein
MKTVFADTSFYIGLLCPHDAIYQRCTDFDLAYAGHYLTSDFVLIELGNWLASTRDRGVFVEFNRLLRGSSRTTILAATAGWIADGLSLYAERPDKEWSVTDCISIQMMRKHAVTEVLTADRHFTQAGFNALLADGAK